MDDPITLKKIEKKIHEVIQKITVKKCHMTDTKNLIKNIKFLKQLKLSSFKQSQPSLSCF